MCKWLQQQRTDAGKLGVVIMRRSGWTVDGVLEQTPLLLALWHNTFEAPSRLVQRAVHSVFSTSGASKVGM